MENDSGESLPSTERRDVVIVIRSDTPSSAIVRRKELIGPIWVNREAQKFSGVPEFYFVASTRALKSIASVEILQEFELGYENLAIGPAPGTIGGPREFRTALLRSRKLSELYVQHEGAVSFLSGSLFRTTVSLPPNVPSGNLKVSVYAFSQGQVTSSNSMTLFIDKSGIERQLTEFAQMAPIAYGLAVVFISVLAGFLASVAFRDRH
jgi:uncharacterized protein (TIGR02186 family)